MTDPASPVSPRRPATGLRRAVLFALAVLGLVAALSYAANPMVRGAERYAASVATAAGATYLTLRSLNAFLSTAQEVEVGGTLVLSGTAQPMKALEPVDDTIERVAGLVFFVMVATGILSVAMGPAAALGFAMLALAALAAALRLPSGVARRLGWYGAFLALALPLSFLASSLLAERMTEAALTRHEAVIARVTAQVDTPITTEGGGGWSDGMRALWSEIDRYQTLAANLYAEADALVASLIGILAVFVFRLMVLPGLILGALFAATRSLARASP